MIGYLKGTVIEISDGAALLDVGGIGYLVEMPASLLEKLPAKGSTARLYTQLIIKDDRISLYGFPDKKALTVFKVLLEVSGVGPKLALNILSVLTPDELISDIAKGETSRIRSVHGVGKKTAARICVDLKEKASRILSEEGKPFLPETETRQTDLERSPVFDDAVSALVNLGYRPTEAKRAISEVLKGETGLEIHELIKKGLGRLSGAR